jgi:type II secretory ATPase GspE/PulE/Tfp pilus assembly ATPase PilB-like protein/FixJ family two-component response regulator
MNDFAALFTGKARDGEAAPPRAAGYRILLVDDEINVVNALRRVFRAERFDVAVAASAEEGLRQLQGGTFQVVISDFMMPGMNGADFLKQVKAEHPDTIRIMLTGHADTQAVMGAIKEGAVYKFILKPWNDDDLRVTVALALEQYDLVQKNRRLQQENEKNARQLQSLSLLAVSNRSQLAIMLRKRNLLSDQQVQELHRLQQLRKEPMIKLLLDKDWVDEELIRGILRKDLLVEEVALDEFPVERAVLELVPRTFCERQWVVPLKLQGRRLTLAVADPLDQGLLEDLRFVSGMELEVVLAAPSAIRHKLQELYGESVCFDELETFVPGADPLDSIQIVLEEDTASIEDLLRDTDEPPAIRLVNAIILEAVRHGVSDIHIQPRIKSVVVRYRIDGVLLDKIHVPLAMHRTLVSRIKVMAELDITERRKPQDGRITVQTPMRVVDLRISTLPTINGEKVVMRVLDRNAAIHTVDALGFSAANRAQVLRMVAKPQGIVLATGPTGSGKTTTLYSLLQHDATSMKNYVTIEDPVEFYLDMAGQVHVREKVGLSFAKVLRAILRQDPDVILLGEIRDLETAEVAFHAALTGHQVFSTLHTNSAIATIARLFDLGLKPYIIASSLEGVIAQRLVRRICRDCSAPVEPDRAVLDALGPSYVGAAFQHRRGAGCERCHRTGYLGRAPIHEVLTPDDELRDLISRGASIVEINQHAARAGLVTLLDDAREKVAQGITTVDEVLRVLGPQND